jgi:hypothetical protein
MNKKKKKQEHGQLQQIYVNSVLRLLFMRAVRKLYTNKCL